MAEEALMGFHRNFCRQAEQAAGGFDPCYLPGSWVPHCTLAPRLSQTQLQQAMETVIKAFTPMTATITHIGLARIDRQKELGTYALGKA